MDNIYHNKYDPDIASGNTITTISSHPPKFNTNPNLLARKHKPYVGDIRISDQGQHPLICLKRTWKWSSTQNMETKIY